MELRQEDSGWLADGEPTIIDIGRDTIANFAADS